MKNYDESTQTFYAIVKSIWSGTISYIVNIVITWLCEINLTSLHKHRVFLVKSTGSLKSTGT